MPYIPIPDGSAFTAESLNLRFDAVTGLINDISPTGIRPLGLGPNHIPELVVGSTLTTETPSTVVATPDVKTGSPKLVNAGFTGLGGTGFETFTAVSGYSITPDGGRNYTLDRAADATTATALFILANVEVKRFTGIDIITTARSGDSTIQEWGISLNEYEWDATIMLEFEDSAGTKGYLVRTERQVSPRVTIGSQGNGIIGPDGPLLTDPPVLVESSAGDYLEGRIAMSPLRDLPGHSVTPGTAPHPVVNQWDHRTYQDVSIRAMVSLVDLAKMVDVTGATVTLQNIRSVRFAFSSINNRAYFVQRANISVLPLIAEVVS